GPLLEAIAVIHQREPYCERPDSVEHPSQLNAPWYRWPRELFVSLLIEAVERGELPATLDTAYTADAIMAALNPMLYSGQRRERGYSQERILQGLRHIFITGVKATCAP
ncbi:MAG TPA: hypothetical protein VKQ36_09875, partial [Ktedonobacterales bacterium]|nr:hypothetical protein [Ktedonobacterales bacterium]